MTDATATGYTKWKTVLGMGGNDMREGIHRDRTKYGLNEALKELMRKKPLD